MSALLHIGIDAGGTKTALLARAGARTVERTAPGVHLLREGLETSASMLEALVRDAASGEAVESFCVGIAGAGREEDRLALEAALTARLGGVSVRVVHDAEIALHAAWEDESGAVLIVGTGSVLFARDEEGGVSRAGGWGWRVGDDGSGTALGRAAIRIALAAYDGGPPSSLVDLLAEDGLDSSDLLRHAVYTEERALASFAPSLVAAAEANDWQAEQALLRETNALAQQAGWLATRLAERARPRLAVTGGLTLSETYRPRLLAALERHLPGWSIATSERQPVEGALAIAESLVAA